MSEQRARFLYGLAGAAIGATWCANIQGLISIHPQHAAMMIVVPAGAAVLYLTRHLRRG